MADVLTFLLTDVEGSTALWEQHPTEMAAALARHDAIVERAVTAAGGELVKSRGEGDATFSVFRLASDALTAAAELVRALRAEEWPAATPIHIRAGVLTGEVEGRDGDWYGTTVNRAARLRSLATGDQVLVATSTAAMAGDTLPPGVAIADLGTHPLKDLQRPERVFELRVDADDDAGDTRTPSHPPATGAGAATAGAPPARSWVDRAVADGIAGRLDELALLQRAWADAAAGTSGIAVISGEPGIGKTTLAAAVAHGAALDGALVLHGRWDEEALAPFQAFREALRAHAAACGKTVLRTDVGDGVGEISRLLPEVGDRLGGVLAPRPGEPEGERLRLFEAIGGWLRRIAARQPVLLVLDDLHWADRGSLLLLEHILCGDGAVPLLAVVTQRDTAADDAHRLRLFASLSRSVPVTRVPLTGLDAEAVRELVGRAAGREPDVEEEALARWLEEETGGNPFFVRHLLHHLAEIGVDGIVKGESATTSALPETVRDVVRWRIAQLSPPAPDVLAAAAVIGAAFELSVLLAAVDLDEAGVLDVLDEACAAGLLHEEPGSAEGYVFTHAVVRRTLQDSLSRARTARLHRRVAEAIEAARGGPAAAALAHHYAMAAVTGTADQALRWARVAAADARHHLAFEAAADVLRRVVAVLDEHGPDDPATRAELLLDLADALDRAGEWTERDARYLEVAEHARTLGRTDLLVRAALGYRGNLPGATPPSRRARRLVEESLERLGPGDRRNRALLLSRLAQLLHLEEPWEQRRALCDEATQLARDDGDPIALALVLRARATALDGPGDAEDQVRLGDEIEAIGHDVGDDELVVRGVATRLDGLLEIGDVERIETDAARLAELAERLRHPEHLRIVTMLQITQAAREGRFDEAAREADALRDRLERLHHPQTGLIHLTHTYPGCWFRGDVAGHVAVQQAGLAQQPEQLAWAGMLALAYSGGGQRDELAALLDARDPDEVWAQDQNFMWWPAMIGLAVGAADCGDRRWAATVHEVLSPYAGRHCSIGWTGFFGTVDHHLGALEAVLGRLDEAVEHLTSALADHRAMGARPWTALTARTLAAALRARGTNSDEERAAALEQEDAAIAEELGLRWRASAAPARR